MVAAQANIMNESQGSRENEQPETPAKKKKLYRKPSFRYEKIFETQALSCGKTLMGTICKHSKKVS